MLASLARFSVIVLFSTLVLFARTSAGQSCSDNLPGCFKPVHEMPGFHERTDLLSVDHSVDVHPFGGKMTVSAVDVDLPSLSTFGLRVRRVFNSTRLTVPLPLPSPAIHDGPLGLGWTFHYGVLWPPALPQAGSMRWALVNGDGSVEVFYNHNFLNSDLPITSNGTNPEWISASMKVLRLVTANVEYELLTPNGLKYTFTRPSGFASSRFVPTRVEDRHGNVTTIVYTPTQDYIEHPIIDYISDEEGRRLTFIYEPLCTGPSCTPGPMTWRRLKRVEFKKGSGSGTPLAHYTHEPDNLGAYALLQKHETEAEKVTLYTNDLNGGTDGVGSILSVTLPTGGVIGLTYEIKNFHATSARDAWIWAVKTLSRSGFVTTYGYSENAAARELTATLTTKQGTATVRTQTLKYITYSSGTSCTEAWKAGFPKSSGDSFNGTSNSVAHAAPNAFKISNDTLSPNCGEQIFVPQPVSVTKTQDGFDFVTTYSEYDVVNLPQKVTLPGGFVATRVYHKVASNTRLLLGLEKENSLADPGGQLIRKMTNNLSGTAIRPTHVDLTRKGTTAMAIDLGYYDVGGKRGAVSTWTVGTYSEGYDYENGSLKSVNYPAGPDISRVINPIGTIQSETRNGYSTSFAWDADLRLKTVTPPSSELTTDITYGSTRVELRRGGGSSPLKLALDSDGYGRLTSRSRAIESGVSAVESFGGFSPFDLPTEETIAAGALYTIQHDVEGRVTSRSATNDSHSYAYAADADGTSITHTRNGNVRVERLDHAGRPLGGTLGARTVALDYVDVGGSVDTKGRITADGQPATSDIGWNGLAEIEDRSTPETGALTFGRTPQGWLESITRPGLSHDFGLDGVGRIQSVSKRSGTQVTQLASFAYQTTYGSLEAASTTPAATGFLGLGVTVDPSDFDSVGRPKQVTVTIPRALQAPVVLYPRHLFCFQLNPYQIVPNGGIPNPYQAGNPDTIKWSEVGGADRYQVEIRSAFTSPGSNVPSCELGTAIERIYLSDNTISFGSLSSVLTPGAPYCLRARATRGDEIGPFSFWELFKIREPTDPTYCPEELPELWDSLDCGKFSQAISAEGGTGEEMGCGDDNPPDEDPPAEPVWTLQTGLPDTVKLTIGLVYDGEGRVETLTHPAMDTSFSAAWSGSQAQAFTFTTAGGHEKVKYGGFELITGTDHFQDGQPKKLTLNHPGKNFAASGVTGVFERSFDSLGRIEWEKATQAGLDQPTLYHAQNFQYHGWQFVESYTRADGGLNHGVSYGYSPDRRLDTFSIGVESSSHGWDAAGNRTSRGAISLSGLDLPGWGTAGTGAASLELPAFSGQTYANNRPDGRTHDADGRETGDGQFGYVYNDQNQIARVVDLASGWDVAQYVYDPSGNRVREVYENEVVYSARTLDGKLVTQEVHRGASSYAGVYGYPYSHKIDFIYHDGVHVASILNLRGDTVYPIHHHRNFARHPVVSLGANHNFIPEYYEYSPFGTQMRTERFARFLPTEFSGYEHDSSTGRYYLRARFLDPELGRFNRADEGFDYDFTEAGSFNLYSYARGNPVAFRDPSGRVVETALVLVEAQAIGIAVSGAVVSAALVGGALVAGTAVVVLGAVGLDGAALAALEWAADWSSTPDISPGAVRSVDPQGAPFDDPSPPNYASGHPSRRVVDHRKNRARGGHPTDPANLNPDTWEANARKAGFEGNYTLDVQRYVDMGLDEKVAESVLAGEDAFILNDVHARPVDPTKLEKLPNQSK